MKKVLSMVVAAMMATLSVQAQEEAYLKHEIGVSYGALSNSDWMSIGDVLGTYLFSFGQFSYDDTEFTGPIGLEYFYHVNEVVGIGAIGVYASETKDMLMGGKKYGEAKSTYITLLPAAKFNWLRKKYFGMYSKVGAGVCIRTRNEDYTLNSESHDDSEHDVLFNFQVTGIGLEVGSPNVRAFGEIGVGEQGIFVAGLRCKF